MDTMGTGSLGRGDEEVTLTPCTQMDTLGKEAAHCKRAQGQLPLLCSGQTAEL